jgi:hypothetical protein
MACIQAGDLHTYINGSCRHFARPSQHTGCRGILNGAGPNIRPPPTHSAVLSRGCICAQKTPQPLLQV